jgi:hypothetical protein
MAYLDIPSKTASIMLNTDGTDDRTSSSAWRPGNCSSGRG